MMQAMRAGFLSLALMLSTAGPVAAERISGEDLGRASDAIARQIEADLVGASTRTVTIAYLPLAASSDSTRAFAGLLGDMVAFNLKSDGRFVVVASTPEAEFVTTGEIVDANGDLVAAFRTENLVTHSWHSIETYFFEAPKAEAVAAVVVPPQPLTASVSTPEPVGESGFDRWRHSRGLTQWIEYGYGRGTTIAGIAARNPGQHWGLSFQASFTRNSDAFANQTKSYLHESHYRAMADFIMAPGYSLSVEHGILNHLLKPGYALFGAGATYFRVKSNLSLVINGGQKDPGSTMNEEWKPTAQAGLGWTAFGIAEVQVLGIYTPLTRGHGIDGRKYGGPELDFVIGLRYW